MAYLGSWKIDDYLTFCCNTHSASTGAATDADAVPSYRIYEDETGTAILTGSMAKLDDASTTGFYSEQIQLTVANGFEKGKCYTIYISAAVNSVTGTMHHTFQIEAEVDANVVSDKTGYGLTDGAITAAKFAPGAIDADAVADGAIDAGALAADAITAAKIADGAIDAGAIATDAITAAKIAADAITSSELATSAAQEIADEVLKRGVANVEDAADTTSLCAIILAALESSISGTAWTIRKTGGGTFVVKTITPNPDADPIIGVT